MISSSQRGSLDFFRRFGGLGGFAGIRSSSPLSPSRWSALLLSRCACIRWARFLRLFLCFTSTSMAQTLQPPLGWPFADIASIYHRLLDLWRIFHPVQWGFHQPAGFLNIAHSHTHRLPLSPYTIKHTQFCTHRKNNIYNSTVPVSQYHVKCRDAHALPCGGYAKHHYSFTGTNFVSLNSLIPLSLVVSASRRLYRAPL